MKEQGNWDDTHDESLTAWRSELLTRVLVGSLVLALVATIAGTLNQLQSGRTWLVVVYWGFLLIIVLLALVRRIPYVLKAGGTLTLFYLLGLSEILTSGLTSDAELFFVAFVVMAAVLLSGRVAIGCLALTTATVVTAAFLIVSGRLGLDPAIRPESFKPGSWFSYTVVFLFVSGVLTGSVWFLRNRYSSALVEMDRRVRRLARIRTRQLEEQKREAEEASRTKTEFLSRISHELRTPLTPIIGFADILGSDPAIGGDQRSSALEISVQAKRLLALIDEVLRLADADRGAAQLQIQSVAVPPAVDQVVEILSDRAGRAEVHLKRGVDPSWELSIQGDPMGFQEVLLRMVSNAIQFSPPGSSVTVNVQTPENERVRIEVAAPEATIPERYLATIFEPLSEFGTADDHGEIGSGLALAQKLVVLMKGRIGITRETGYGPILWLEMPLSRS